MGLGGHSSLMGHSILMGGHSTSRGRSLAFSGGRGGYRDRAHSASRGLREVPEWVVDGAEEHGSPAPTPASVLLHIARAEVRTVIFWGWGWS